MMKRMATELRRLAREAELDKRPYVVHVHREQVMDKRGSAYVYRSVAYIPDLETMGNGEYGYMTPARGRFLAYCMNNAEAIADALARVAVREVRGKRKGKA